MSYDLRIAVKVAGTPKGEELYAVIDEPDLSSPTYNLGKMFRACTGWNYEHGKWYKVSDVYAKIERGILELTYNEQKYLPMNPENGWGDTKDALRALESLKECIDGIENPHGCYGGWNVIPKGLLYVAW